MITYEQIDAVLDRLADTLAEMGKDDRKRETNVLLNLEEVT